MNFIARMKDIALSLAYRRSGLLRLVNGLPIRIVPRYRNRFPSEYDPQVANYLRTRVSSGMICLNVGANVGVYALQLSHWCRPTGTVFAFEPNPISAKILARHIDLNNRNGSSIRLIQRAVSSTPGIATLYFEGSDGMSRLGDANPELIHPHRIDVEVTTLDDFCNAEKIVPDWVIMDIEGFEVAALIGFRRTLAAYPGKIGLVVELHPNAWSVAGNTLDEFLFLIHELKLRPIPLTGQTCPLEDYGIVAFESAYS